MKLSVRITQEIIDTAECKNPTKCAFAEAINDLIPNTFVGGTYIMYLREPVTDYELEMFKAGSMGVVVTILSKAIAVMNHTMECKTFIRGFDIDKKFAKPSAFEIEIPDTVIEFWYKDHVDVAAKIANSEVLQIVE